MEAKQGTRFRVLTLVAAALLGCAGCSAAGSDDDAANPSETAAQSQSPKHEPLPDSVQAPLEDALISIMDRYQVPGAAVMVTTPRGSWSTERGVADLESQELIEPDMAWPLRSVTKSVTVTVLLQLVDEGELSLDDTIDQYVDGVPHGAEITLRQLANMTSGVGDYTHSEAFVERLTDDPSQQFTLDELNGYGIAEGPYFEPGDDHVYSNTSPNLLAVVIEEVTGQPIREVIEERIIDELGLGDTVYPESDEDWVTPHAQGYQPADGAVSESFNNFSSMAASGAMISTTTDMTVWAEALATGELISPQLQEERLEGAPLSEGPEYDDYALGIGSLEGWWGHTGEGLGFTALAMYDLEADSSVVIFMNISDAVDDAGQQRHVPTALMREYAQIIAKD